MVAIAKRLKAKDYGLNKSANCTGGFSRRISVLPRLDGKTHPYPTCHLIELLFLKAEMKPLPKADIESNPSK